MKLQLRALRGVTCNMGSHSVTCLPTQANIPLLNPSQRLVLDLPTPGDGRFSWPRWPVTCWDGLPVPRRSPVQVLTRQRMAGSRTRLMPYTTTPRSHHVSSTIGLLAIASYALVILVTTRLW